MIKLIDFERFESRWVGRIVEKQPESRHTEPEAILSQLRQRMAQVTNEYSAGKLNEAQFNAMYTHYMEKRTIVEALLARNPNSDVWKTAASTGKTSYLRSRFESRLTYYVVFHKSDKKPLISEGKISRRAAKQVHHLLQSIWKSTVWRKGMARMSLGEDTWLLLMAGDNSMTIAIYFMQPSTLQTNRLRDLHHDFERANRRLLEENMSAQRMVFPQRALHKKV